VGPFGALGVDVFFVLSGFLITTLLNRERERFGRVSVRDFYVRRGLRIIPAYACFLLFVAGLAAIGLSRAPARDWVAAGTYTMNFVPQPAWELGHTWSLSIEEHFYLAWPLAFVLLPRRAAFGLLVAVLICEPIIRWAILIAWPACSAMTDLWTFTRLDAIAAGCLLAMLPRSQLGLRWIETAARCWPLALVLFAAGIVAGAVSGKAAVGVTPTVTALTIAVLVWAAARRPPRWLEHPAMIAIGVGSYSLYLWQQPFLCPHSSRWWSAFPQNLLFAGLAALGSYWLVERPMLRMKDRYQARAKPVKAAEVPVNGLAGQESDIRPAVPVIIPSARNDDRVAYQSFPR
jgi:peptidoglycan/LPS O-acetylase OafA/YrhL